MTIDAHVAFNDAPCTTSNYYQPLFDLHSCGDSEGYSKASYSVALVAGSRTPTAQLSEAERSRRYRYISMQTWGTRSRYTCTALERQQRSSTKESMAQD